MRVVRNIGHVKRRKRLAKWSALAGFAMLGSTFWLALNPKFIIIAYLPLLAGTIIFHYGMQQVSRWNRNPRNDVLLDQRLQHLGDKYSLIHYSQLGKRTVDHLLVHPAGVLVLTVRELPGKVTYRRGRWRKSGGGIGRLFGMGGPQLGSPTAETDVSVKTVEAFLAEADYQADVDGVIVFMNPLAELDVEEPDYPVTNGEGLSDFIRTLAPDPGVPGGDTRALTDLLSRGEELEQPVRAPRRRPVRKRAA